MAKQTANPRLIDVFGSDFTQEDVGFAIPRLQGDISLYVDPFLLWVSDNATYRDLHERVLGFLRLVGEMVARGEVEIGFQQVSELIHVSGIDFLGPLPPDIQHITIFSSGIHTGATKPDAAKALVKFLTSPSATMVIKKNGMEPG